MANITKGSAAAQKRAKSDKQGAAPKKRNAKREGWNAEKLGEQSSYDDETEIGRRLRRGDETKGDADARDAAGTIPLAEMPEQREDQDTTRTSESSSEEADR